jgi:hypothetical protein
MTLSCSTFFFPGKPAGTNAVNKRSSHPMIGPHTRRFKHAADDADDEIRRHGAVAKFDKFDSIGAV